MNAKKPATWRDYEEVARYLLEQMGNELGLGLERVEGKQKLVCKSGAIWEVDAKGVKTEDGAIVVIECRQLVSKLKQEDMRAFVYGIADAGAAGGIVVTTIGVQEGAQKIARYEGIDVIRLNRDATTTDFMLELLEKVIAGRSVKFGGTGTLTFKVEAIQQDKPQS